MDLKYPLSLAVFRCLLQLRVRLFPFLELELKYFLTSVKVHSRIAASGNSTMDFYCVKTYNEIARFCKSIR